MTSRLSWAHAWASHEQLMRMLMQADVKACAMNLLTAKRYLEQRCGLHKDTAYILTVTLRCVAHQGT